MKEIPILCSTPMVQAIQEGRKTMTRRVVKPQPYESEYEPGLFHVMYRQPETVTRKVKRKNPETGEWEEHDSTTRKGSLISATGEIGMYTMLCPYKVGDILWVRETWLLGDDGYHYRANATPHSEQARKDYGYKWRPSIHMPRSAARIFLEVKSVRVERLRDISEADVKAEGFDLTDIMVGKRHFVAFTNILKALKQKKGHTAKAQILC